MHALAIATGTGHAEEVYRNLTRLDRALTNMAERAARFYLLLGELARTTDVRAEVILHHKDALLSHTREFHAEYQGGPCRQADRAYRELLGEVLDYRRWRTFSFFLHPAGGGEEPRRVTPARG